MRNPASHTEDKTVIGNTFARYAQTITDNWRSRFAKYGKIYEKEKKWSDIYALLRLETEREVCLRHLLEIIRTICVTIELCEHIVTNTNETIYWTQTTK